MNAFMLWASFTVPNWLPVITADSRCLKLCYISRQHFHQHSGDTDQVTSQCEYRAYDSSLDFPTPTERHVYPTVLDRAPVSMQAALRPLLPASAFKPPLAAPATGNGKLRGVPVG